MSQLKVNVIFILITFNDVHPILSNGHEVSQSQSTEISEGKQKGIKILKELILSLD